MRFATLGLIEFEPELIVSGINHGSNLGDDITYSGTVAAALEGVVLGIPAIAVSQQADHGELDFRAGRAWEPEDFEQAARVRRAPRRGARGRPDPRGHAAQHQLPRRARSRARGACRLGKRDLPRPAGADRGGGTAARRYRIYGEEPGYHHEEGTDFAAIADGTASPSRRSTST